MNWNLFTSFCAAVLFVGITKLLFGNWLGVSYCLYLTAMNVFLTVYTHLVNKKQRRLLDEWRTEWKKNYDKLKEKSESI